MFEVSGVRFRVKGLNLRFKVWGLRFEVPRHPHEAAFFPLIGWVSLFLSMCSTKGESTYNLNAVVIEIIQFFIGREFLIGFPTVSIDSKFI